MTLVMLALWVARVLSTTQGGSADLAQPSVAGGHLPFVVNVLPWQGIKSYEYHYNTGTHDNETAVGWWKDSATDAEKEYIKRYLHTNGKDIAGDFMRESFKSVSKTSIVMLQDIMRLDNTARMNFPGTTTNNWGWRVGETNIWGKLKKQGAEIKGWLEDYDRTADINPPA